MSDDEIWTDEPPEHTPEQVERMHREVMIRDSMDRIALGRSLDSRIALCAKHLNDYYSDRQDLAFIAGVLSKEKIERPQDLSNVGVQIRVDEIRENENTSFEIAVERFASRQNMSVSAVKKAITRANKGF